MLMKYTRAPFKIKTKIFALPYALALILLTILFRWIRVPPSYFSNSKNVFNVFFMKYSYYYVIAFLLPFVVLLHLVNGFGNWRHTVAPFVRVVVNFAILFFLSFDFDVVGCLLGVCFPDDSGRNVTTTTGSDPIESTCEFYGHVWKPFDISGHMFHNLYGTFIIMEEGKKFDVWDFVEKIVKKVRQLEDIPEKVREYIDRTISEKKQTTVTKFHEKLELLLKANLCALALVWLGLIVANVITAVYFHSIVENVIAAVMAIAFWLLCYKVIFPLYGKHEDSLEAHLPIVMSIEKEELEALKSKVQKSYNSV